MFRDFSESAKAKLLAFVEEVTETTLWGKVGDSISDNASHVMSWFGYLNINNYVNNMDEYQKKVIDRNNITANRVEEIFAEVNEIDARNGRGLSGAKDTSNSLQALLNTLAETINPNGGNLDMEQMRSVLKAKVEEFQQSRATLEDIIENENLGMNPDATEMSADPVNLSTGNFVYNHEDMKIEGEIPISFHRYYNSKDTKTGSIGRCYLHNYEMSLKENEDDSVEIRLSDGQVNRFEKTEDNQYIARNVALQMLTKNESGFLLVRSGEEKIQFSLGGQMLRKEDMNHRGIQFTYNEKNQLLEAKTDTGMSLTYSYNEDELLEKVCDHTGRVVALEYEEQRLHKVKVPSGATYVYNYGMNGRITEVVNAREVRAVKNIYDKNFRIIKQEFPDGGTMSFEYDDANRRVIMTERNGAKTIHVHDEKYRNIETIYHDGSRETFIYNDYNQCISKRNRNGNVTRMAYDNRGNLTQVIDPMKKKENYTYDANNRLVSVSVNGKQRLKNSYDKNGNIVKSTDALGHESKFEYDDKGRLLNKIYPDNSKDSMTYDTYGNVLSQTNQFGGIIQYEYNELNQIVKITDGNGNESKFEYDALGHLVKEENALGDKKCFEYSKEGLLLGTTDYNGTKITQEYNTLNLVGSITDQLGYTTKYQYDEMWNISKTINSDGASLHFTYDKNNRLVEERNELNNPIIYKYNANGDKISEEIADSKTEFSYDKVGHLISVKDSEGNVTNYTYQGDNLSRIEDALGNTLEFTYDDASQLILEKSSNGELRKYEYTSMGDVKTIEDETGRQMVYTYMLGGEKVESILYTDGNVQRYAYDKNGNLASLTDQHGNIQEYRYDALNRVIKLCRNGEIQKVIEYDKVGNIVQVKDHENNTTQYVYTARGELSKVIDALGNEAEYIYDEKGYLIQSIQKGNGNEESRINTYKRNIQGQIIQNIDTGGNSEFYKYNGIGLLCEKMDKEGYLTSYKYTKRGDLSFIKYGDGREVAFTYNELRYLQEVEDWDGKTKIENDSLGRAVGVTYPNGEKIEYTYNTIGNRTSLTYSDGMKVQYNYDTLQRLTSIQSGNNITKYEYDSFGNLSKKLLPNGIETLYKHNNAGLMEKIINKSQGENLDEYNIKYNLNGRKESVEKIRKGVNQDSGLFSFEYDEIGRMVGVRKNEQLLRRYRYDAFGNRTQKEENESTVKYEYNELGQLIKRVDDSKIEVFSYDKRGNLNKIIENGESKFEYAYGALNRIEEAKSKLGSCTYYYNGLGHRVGMKQQNKVKESATAFTLDMTKSYNNLLSKNENGVISRYIWDDKILGLQMAEKNSYLIQDEMGSPIRMTDRLGQVQETYGYDEFGNDLESTYNENNPFGYTGYQRDYIAGTYYAQAREYIPSIGRFASRDFIKGRQDDLISLNEYTYCKDDPENYEDLNGKFVLTTIAICAGVGALVSGGINGISQGVKIAKGEQEEFKWGEFMGSVVEGAIVGGVSATGVGVVGTIIAGGAGAASKSIIEQGVDEGTVNAGQVVVDTTVGAITSGVFYGIGKAVNPIKEKFFGKSVKKILGDEIAENKAKIIAKNTVIDNAKKATGRTSPHRLRQLADLKSIRKSLVGDYAVKELLNGGKKVIKHLVMESMGWKTLKGISKGIFKRSIVDVVNFVFGPCTVYA